ncbi:glycoside hydrolase family 3 N-terminal domain-containing protein [Microvirga massiliensis]|uniref:glycoside hydrolase family 3 N-terminal domain-containing protein n=1 Tax=Microvirga massiliensis TaxID=1033741 RepID=UPI000AC744B1|nr:glycoside hydrolase family 3 N-terminal domain-containing protein [Microvirga massiliensis]
MPLRFARALVVILATLPFNSPIVSQESKADPAVSGWPATARDDVVETQVEDLLRRMTLEEKIGQLNLVSHGPPLKWNEISEGRIGALLNFNAAGDIARAQALARQSRLGIPPLFGLDVLHGFRTQFPIPLGEAAAFNPERSREAAAWAAREASHIGVQWTFAPMADLSRDIRWGRIVEGFGEDPHLGAVLTAARVEGFRQGGLATAVKHFAGYGAPQGGRDYDASSIPPAELRDLYLPPFRAAFAAGSVSVMAAFTALNGVPVTANSWLLEKVLRDEIGFDGFVTSDWAGIHELLGHGVAATEAEAARKALLAGVDMDMMGELYIQHIPDEVRAGRVPIEAVDEAARRVLRVKFRLGLFDRPDADPAHVDAVFPSAEARAASRAVARETLVLLHNRGDVLPIGPDVRRIAVIGPLADAPRDQLGPHAARAHASDSVTILEGIKWRARSSGIAVSYHAACDRLCSRDDGFAEALEAARQADLVIAVFGEPETLSGEAASRAHLGLNGRQPAILRALAELGKPMALVLVAGRPLILDDLAETIPAILMAWYPGTEGGSAVADVLFGDVTPSGKLPVSWPRSVGQIPIYYNRLPSGRPTLENNRFTLNYIDEAVTPLFPFGYGLGYSRFEYLGSSIADTMLTPSDTLAVTVTLRNAGARPGQEVVQLYIRDPVASRSRPLRELKAFRKVALQAGEQRSVVLSVPVRDLGFHRDDGTYVVEAGAIQLFVGGSSLAEPIGQITITKELQLPPGARQIAGSEPTTTAR